MKSDERPMATPIQLTSTATAVATSTTRFPNGCGAADHRAHRCKKSTARPLSHCASTLRKVGRFGIPALSISMKAGPRSLGVQTNCGAADGNLVDQEIVILGGGPAGLTAAYQLAKEGIRTTVVEKDDVVGGISRTVNYKGFRFDIGGH